MLQIEHFFSSQVRVFVFLHFDYVQAILLPLFFIYFHRSFFSVLAPFSLYYCSILLFYLFLSSFFFIPILIPGSLSLILASKFLKILFNHSSFFFFFYVSYNNFYLSFSFFFLFSSRCRSNFLLFFYLLSR